jgi:Lon protease-like protein
MEKPNRIPLFPLELVLFPSLALPLHIFKPRYKIMIQRCLSERIEFGIVPASKETVATVGCTADILFTGALPALVERQQARRRAAGNGRGVN